MKSFSAFSLALAMGLMACGSTGSGAKISTQYDPGASFGSYKTYDWVTSVDQPGVNPFLSQTVRAAIASEMSAKGYRRSADGDIAIAFTLGARDKVEVRDYGAYSGFYPGYGLRRSYVGWHPTYAEPEIREVTEGSLAIDVYDAASKMPIWHSRASKKIRDGQPDPAKINLVTEEMMKDFPAANAD